MRLSLPQATYEYTDADGSRLVISSHESQRDVHLDVTENDSAGMFFPFEDVPRVALELLRAAGYGDKFERSRSEWLTVELLEDLATETEAKKADA